MDEPLFIDGKQLLLKKDDRNRQTLYLRHDSDTEIAVTPRRLFPLSRPDEYIYFIDEDEKERGILRQLREAPRPVKEFISSWLEEYYFIPCITEIHTIEEEYGISHWMVTTNRGKRGFEIRNRSTDIIILDNRRILLKDVDDNTYEIPDYGELPQKSQMLLEGET